MFSSEKYMARFQVKTHEDFFSSSYQSSSEFDKMKILWIGTESESIGKKNNFFLLVLRGRWPRETLFAFPMLFTRLALKEPNGC